MAGSKPLEVGKYYTVIGYKFTPVFKCISYNKLKCTQSNGIWIVGEVFRVNSGASYTEYKIANTPLWKVLNENR